MTTITINRAVVEQALEAMRGAVPTGEITLYEWHRAISDLDAALAQQAEPAQDQRCRAEPRFDGDFVCDCKIGECPRRSAALAQQAERTPPDAAAGLVDDLCLLHMGWKTDAEDDLYRAAWGRVIARAKQLKAQVGKGEEK